MNSSDNMNSWKNFATVRWSGDGISLIEKFFNLPCIRIHTVKIGVDQKLTILFGDLTSGSHKSTDDNVEDTEEHDENEQRKERLVCPVNTHQRLYTLLPRDAARYTHEQG